MPSVRSASGDAVDQFVALIGDLAVGKKVIVDGKFENLTDLSSGFLPLSLPMEL